MARIIVASSFVVLAALASGCESIAGLERTSAVAPEADDDAGTVSVDLTDASTGGTCAPTPRASQGGACPGAVLTLTPDTPSGEAAGCAREVEWAHEDYATVIVDTSAVAHGTLTLTLRVASGSGHVSFDLFDACAVLPSAVASPASLIGRHDVGPRTTATMVAHFLRGQPFQLGVTGGWMPDGGDKRDNRWSISAVVTPD